MRGFDFKEYKIEQTASTLYPFMGKKVFRSSLGSKGAGKRYLTDFPNCGFMKKDNELTLSISLLLPL